MLGSVRLEPRSCELESVRAIELETPEIECGLGRDVIPASATANGEVSRACLVVVTAEARRVAEREHVASLSSEAGSVEPDRLRRLDGARILTARRERCPFRRRFANVLGMLGCAWRDLDGPGIRSTIGRIFRCFVKIGLLGRTLTCVLGRLRRLRLPALPPPT